MLRDEIISPPSTPIDCALWSYSLALEDLLYVTLHPRPRGPTSKLIRGLHTFQGHSARVIRRVWRISRNLQEEDLEFLSESQVQQRDSGFYRPMRAFLFHV